MGRTAKENRKRGTIEERGDRKWLVRVFTGMSPEGKRKYSSRIVRGTISQAQQALTALHRDLDTETFIAPSKVTLGEFAKQWLENSAPMRVSITTLIGYKSSFKRITAALGHVRLEKLTPQMIQQFYASLDADGLSYRTIEYAHTVLKMCLEQAVIWKIIARNPTHGADRPAKNNEERKEVEAFNAEETDLFLEAARGHQLEAMWLMFTATGLRPQEMFPLKWTDLEERVTRQSIAGKYVDADSHIIVVQRAMKHVGGGKYEVSTRLKTKKSRRVVSIPRSVVDALNAHKRRQAEMMLAAGESFERNGYIFPNKVGRPLDVNNVRDMFHAICKTAGIRKIKLYGLRHTHATLLLSAGVPLKIVSERLGHASIMLTGDIYSHVMPAMETETAHQVEHLLFSKRTSKEA